MVNAELILSDLEIVEKRIEKIGRMAKSGEKKYVFEYELLKKIRDELVKGVLLKNMELSEEEKAAEINFS